MPWPVKKGTELPERHRELLRLLDEEKLTKAQVGRQLGISGGRVASLERTARWRLRFAERARELESAGLEAQLDAKLSALGWFDSHVLGSLADGVRGYLYRSPHRRDSLSCITTLRQLLELRPAQVLMYRGIGRKSLAKIEAELTRRGLELQLDQPSRAVQRATTQELEVELAKRKRAVGRVEVELAHRRGEVKQ